MNSASLGNPKKATTHTVYISILEWWLKIPCWSDFTLSYKILLVIDFLLGRWDFCCRLITLSSIGNLFHSERVGNYLVISDDNEMFIIKYVFYFLFLWTIILFHTETNKTEIYAIKCSVLHACLWTEEFLKPLKVLLGALFRLSNVNFNLYSFNVFYYTHT